MDYKQEYDEYWSRPDRWGSHSFPDAEAIADQILSVCGKGKVLDVGFGMGLLSQTLLKRGVDIQGMDVAEKVVREAEKLAPGRFKVGSVLEMPYPDHSFQTVVSTDCLEHIAEADVPRALKELYRVTQRYVYVRLATTQDRDKRWHLTIRNRAWWEMQFFEAGFRKHPALQTIVPYEALEQDGRQITLLFEKIPAAALAKHPLAALKAERDLHMDMLREPGRRSDAHLARYTLARQFLPPAGLVLDAACGLGYGSATLAAGLEAMRVRGIDSSAYAIDYGRTHFSPGYTNVEFAEGDVCHLGEFADGSVDLVVSFETIEHLPRPELFLQEVRRVLKPGGIFIGSVPNLWVDETGKDPNPWHFHTFDLPRLLELCGRFFPLHALYSQTAGGGMKLTHAPRKLRPMQLPVTEGHAEAEWWIIVSKKEEALPAAIVSARERRRLTVIAPGPKHPLYTSWLPEWKLPHKFLQPSEARLDILKQEAALVVTHDTYLEPGRRLLGELVSAGIPTLILADGILEYRNTWEHPQLPPGAIFQPVLGHKISCLGRSQARYLESWGNAGKCEIVGSPRLDRYFTLQRRQKPANEPFRVLVTTAFTPYFTEGQHLLVLGALRDLKKVLGRRSGRGGCDIETVWRLTKGLDKELGVTSRLTDFTGRELAEVLQEVDAVITTPSTIMLEAMLLGLPVAVLDYSNSPAYVPAAWTIAAREQIPGVLGELLHPPAAKMLFQETTLHDCLECATPAAPRLHQLILTMMACSLEARQTGQLLQFPARLLQPENHGHAPRENRFHLETLYRNHPASQAAPAKPPEPGRSPAPANRLQGHKHLLEPAVKGPKKGKILCVCHEASRTGAPLMLLNLLRWMKAHGNREFRVALRVDGPLGAAFRELGETHVVPALEPASPLLEDVSLIYSNTCTNGNFLRALPPDLVPVLTHAHELAFTIDAYGEENFDEIKRHTRHFIACADAVAEELRRRGVSAERISVIHESIPVETVLAGAGARTRREIRQWCGFAEDAVIVAGCGFADWRKGPDLFLQLADQLRRRCDGRRKFGFLWIGRLSEDRRGRTLLHDLERMGLDGWVKFAGEQDNPYPFLNASDIFCLSSREDPFPLVMLEAAALGKPVVCFEKAGGAVEFCARGGGFAVPYLNLDAMAGRLIELLENKPLRQQTGKAAAELVNREFRLETTAARVLEQIERFEQTPKITKQPEIAPTLGRKLKRFFQGGQGK